MIIPFKNRVLNPDKPVTVYRNLHSKTGEHMFSVRQSGLIIGHTNNITLMDCEFRVSESGRQRVLREKRKNVHAFVYGYVALLDTDPDKGFATSIAYNPYKYSTFVALIPFKDSNAVPVPVHRAVAVHISANRITADNAQ